MSAAPPTIITAGDKPSDGSARVPARRGDSPLANAIPAVLWVLFAVLWSVVLRKALHKAFAFDDAYMFYRYAQHMQAGMGVTWNPGDAHTYGPTSLLWTFVIFVLHFIPAAPATVLVCASWFCGALAILAIGWAVQCGARSPWLATTWKATAFVALPLALGAAFRIDSVNGMETMLSVAANALSAGQLLRWIARPTTPNALRLAVLGLVAFLCRPDAALAFLLMVGLAGVLLVRPAGICKSALVAGLYLGLLALEALACKLYFKSILPFSFYVKSGHGYDGYDKSWHPAQGLLGFLTGCFIFWLVLFLLSARNNWKLTTVFLVPVFFTSLYYTFRVVQIMGFEARYYIPLAPFVLVPAMLLLDANLQKRTWPSLRQLGFRFAAFALVAIVCRPALLSLDRVLALSKPAYPLPVASIAATTPLPATEWFDTQKILADEVMAGLPSQVSIAATEVGYLGARLPAHAVIDLSGLNDFSSVRHQPILEVLENRKPDLIWFPVQDYTYLYGSIYSSPQLARDYTIFAGMFNYGLAVRKDSPYRQAIMTQLQTASTKIYPGYDLKKYVVTRVTWDPHSYRATLKN